MSLIVEGLGSGPTLITDGLTASPSSLPGTPPVVTALSRPRLGVCELIAACPTFRNAVGATSSAEAILHVYSPFAEDTLIDSGQNDHAGHPIKTVKHARPRALVNLAAMNRSKLGTAYGGGAGSLLVDFEFLPDLNETDPNVRLAKFEEAIGRILDEIEERIGQDKGAGEGVYTGQDVTFINIVNYELLAGPGECVMREEQGIVFLAATFQMDWM